MTNDVDIINIKIEFLKSEIAEYKVYIENCTMTLIYIITVFFGAKNSIDQITSSSILNYVIISSGLILIGAIIYMVLMIIYLSKRSLNQVMNDKKEVLHSWLR